MARPTKYTPEIDETVCARLAGGESLRSICASDDTLPDVSTILRWVVSDREGFCEHYMIAREAAGYAHADRQVDLANLCAEEGIDPQSARVAMQGYQWAAERMAPKKHSARQEVAHSSPDGSMSPKDNTAAVLEALRRKHEQ